MDRGRVDDMYVYDAFMREREERERERMDGRKNLHVVVRGRRSFSRLLLIHESFSLSLSPHTDTHIHHTHTHTHKKKKKGKDSLPPTPKYTCSSTSSYTFLDDMLIKLYLIAYNACCIAGWVQCARYMVEASVKDVTSGQLWNESLGPVLTYVQTAAILEIFHSLFRFVRSPLVPTTIQVASRIVVLWGFTKVSTDAQTDVTSLTLMVLSWSAVEIIRYNFYFLQLLLGKENVPYALFWLRYSAFMLLYPSESQENSYNPSARYAESCQARARSHVLRSSSPTFLLTT